MVGTATLPSSHERLHTRLHHPPPPPPPGQILALYGCEGCIEHAYRLRRCAVGWIAGSEAFCSRWSGRIRVNPWPFPRLLSSFEALHTKMLMMLCFLFCCSLVKDSEEHYFAFRDRVGKTARPAMLKFMDQVVDAT